MDELITDGFGNGYEYDPLYGNLDAKNDVTTFEYDDHNLLKKIHWPDNSMTQFTSDASGNRIRFIGSDGAPTWKFVYDTTAGIPAVVAETVSNGSPKLYIRTPDGRLIAQCHISSGVVYLDHYYHFDGLGSTKALTDSDGDVTDEFKYDVWGNVTRVSGSTDQPYLFVGQLGYYTHYQIPWMDPFDTEWQAFYKNVLLQLGVRYYQPSIGRFTQRDPMSYTDSFSSYAYASYDPLVAIDPNGEFPWAFVIACMKSRPCRAFFACLGAGLGRGAWELISELWNGTCCVWGNIGCKAACACASAGLGMLIPKDVLMAIVGSSFGSALLTPGCACWCDIQWPKGGK